MRLDRSMSHFIKIFCDAGDFSRNGVSSARMRFTWCRRILVVLGSTLLSATLSVRSQPASVPPMPASQSVSVSEHAPTTQASGTSATTVNTIAGATSTSTDKFTFGDGSVRLPFGAADGDFTFIVSADALGKEEMDSKKTLKVEDVREAVKPSKIDVSFKVVAELPPSVAGRRWVVAATARGLALNDEQPRYASLEIGNLKRALPYVLTNRVKVAPDFSLTVNTPWQLNGKNDANTLFVTAGDQTLTGLRLANSTLTEKTNGTPLRTQDFQLCRASSGSCDPPSSLGPLVPHTLYIRILESARSSGRFTGSLAFAVNGRPDAKVVTVDVASTSPGAQVLGGILIAAGVGLAWVLTVWSRNRLDRLAMLRPTLEARRQILELLARLKAAGKVVGIDFKDLDARYSGMASDLTEQQLDDAGLLPTRVPNTLATAVSDLNTRLKSLEQPILGLTIIVREGVEPLTRAWRTAAAADRLNIASGLKALDAPNDATTGDLARALVTKASKIAFPPPPAQPNAVASFVQVAPAQQAKVELQHVTSQIESLSTLRWLVYLAITAGVGIALLVLGNPGFGTPMDFVYCLLWGFGLPTSVEKLQQASPVFVSTAIGVQLPK